ncbi:oxidoreductase [Granulicella arctica]|uniref:NAD(P)-dependent dehydrogenase (Short-subunit alcohol dehydrogenase family) n=1 Tax=Granulicella arctica TaxID=940613 RepID=A0A7Y9TKD1_9BACT|nr:oxidoreductase [Granulicella arctica]NYF79137.1 NAD(P)-dependent dehydrogenase (short-subunit alcohol dehydrogenase family) [Granulicella arctica]
MALNTQPRIWFITGASTGFGRHLAEEILASGGKVIATARSVDKIADLEVRYPGSAIALALDVTDQGQVDSAVTQAFAKFGCVDVLVNNAGYGLAGAIEEAAEAEFMPVFETNVFGLIRVTRSFLPYLRKQRSGHILNLSSIGGLIGSAGWGYYNASKFAVNGFSEALAAELAPLGIHVTIVEPGPFRTDFLSRSGVEAKQRIADYDATAGKTRAYFRNEAGKQKGDPIKAVRAMIAAVESSDPPKHLVLGALAYNRMAARLEQWSRELKAGEPTSLGADFPDTPEKNAYPEAS